MKKQSGFTLIELIVVIVILGILAATALPKFVDLSSDARTASASGIAGAMASASSINYGARALSTGKGISLSGTAATVCSTSNAAWGSTSTGILQGGFPATGYTLGNTGSTTCSTDGYVVCTVTPTAGGSAANATVTCAN